MTYKLVCLEPTPEMLGMGGNLRYATEAEVELIYKAMLEAAPAAPVEWFEMDWPDYHTEAMGCGLEDRNITDRYDAMRYGWDEAIELCAERLPEELYTVLPPVATVELEPVATVVRNVHGTQSALFADDLKHGTKLYALPPDAAAYTSNS